MDREEERPGWDGKIVTLPNLLSICRLALIPLIVWLYLQDRPRAAFAALLVSGATDVLDGFIARKFNMISDIGKALDPCADKATQILILGCIALRFARLRPLLAVLVVRELTMGIMGLVAIKRTGRVMGAVWHGKLTTCVVYATICAHILIPGIPAAATIILTVVSAVVALGSLALYAREYARQIKAAGGMR